MHCVIKLPVNYEVGLAKLICSKLICSQLAAKKTPTVISITVIYVQYRNNSNVEIAAIQLFLAEPINSILAGKGINQGIGWKYCHSPSLINALLLCC